MSTELTAPPERRTEQEIGKLKADWLHDPTWDIEETKGFEAHREELAAWAAPHHERFAKERAAFMERRTAAGFDEIEALGELLDVYDEEYSRGDIRSIRLGLAIVHRLDRLTKAVERLADASAGVPPLLEE